MAEVLIRCIQIIQSNINGYDQSILSDIDNDIHYDNSVDEQYYNENACFTNYALNVVIIFLHKDFCFCLVIG